MNPYFQGELNDVRSKLVLMGEKSIEIVRLALEALVTEETELAKQVIEMDDEIDLLEKQIDSDCIRYISLRAPVASDLRLLAVSMKACHDLERVGDEASSVSKRAIRLMRFGPINDLFGIKPMGDLVVKQLREALNSFINEDLKKAFQVPLKDRKVDDINRDNFQILTDMVKSNPNSVDQAFELIFISKSLERIGDHATNIAEDVIFLLEGDDIRHTDVTKRSAEST
ncbi:phosphate signaling complex protein PhoU [Rubellicoccus peritrichatus]|uniref:Phosphate-specific transport system accessory protein PhoU n=1 Tax=Rubellicoccus peritrichatus TaxID=3080537 RepID=A0AAQ3QSC0_9BACT|nr:phosphate signaling complex protein PhoU [Puniceicoccus sp. CR14]WOO42248.1 phosphate signaling complex protein PhoU [Puniceicoccus sp. CR14]